MDFSYLKEMSTAEISICLGFIVAGLNYLLPPKLVKKLKLDKIQKFFSFLAQTKGGISKKKGE